MYERFTDRARRVMQLANQEAQRFKHEYIGTEHILLGLVKEGSGVAANVLKNLDIDLRKIRQEVEKLVQSGPDMVTMGKLPQTPRAKKVIEYSMEEARNLGHNYVGSEHLLLGLLREQEGVAAQVLMNLGLKLEEVREDVRALLGHSPQEPAPEPLPQQPYFPFFPLADDVWRMLKQLPEAVQKAGHKGICTGYLLLGLRASGGAASRALGQNGLDETAIRRDLSGECPELFGLPDRAVPPYGLRALGAILAAAEEAQTLSPHREIEQQIKTLREEKNNAVAELDFPKAAQIRDKERELSKSLPDPSWTIRLEHVLLGLLRDPDCEAMRIMKAAGASPEAVRAAVLRELGGNNP